MKNLNSQILKKFLKIATQKLEGEWLLVGGTLLPAVGIDIRSTMDIDLIGLGEKERLATLELMGVAEELGLSVDSINQAAAFFLNKVSYKKEDLIPLVQAKNCVIYRPSVLLYWKLKLNRLTESDRIDCQHYLQFCRGQKDSINYVELRKLVESTKSQSNSVEKLESLNLLESCFVD